jgi:hypothetical protein
VENEKEQSKESAKVKENRAKKRVEHEREQSEKESGKVKENRAKKRVRK